MPVIMVSIRKPILAAVLAFIVIQLNIFFAWTSHVGSRGFHGNTGLHALLSAEVSLVTRVQLSIPGLSSYYSNLAHGRGFNTPFSLETKLFIDSEVIVFTIAIFLLSMLLFWKAGSFLPLLRALEITSASVLPLGFEIYFFDQLQFNIHASDIQTKIGLAWFTNADVLYVSSGIFVATLLIDLLRYSRRRNGVKPALMYPQQA